MQTTDIATQKAAAEKEVAAAEEALNQAERAYDQEPSQSKRREVRERREELEEARLGVERAQRLEDAATKAQAEADRQAAIQTIAQLSEVLRGPGLTAALAPLIEREKVARLELMQVALERERFVDELRAHCQTVERLEEQLNPGRGETHPNTRAVARFHSVADTVSVLWTAGVNEALEQAAALSPEVKLHDPLRVALRAVQI